MKNPCEDLAGHTASEVDVSSRVRALGRDVPDAEDFFMTGMVSSLFGMQLINFIENSFAIQVTDQDLVLDNFKSIENISLFIARKRGGW